MVNSLLCELIVRFRKHDMTVFSLIYGEFKNLILFYSGKLGYEDATQELNIFLIELLYSVELENFSKDQTDGLHRYIAVSIRNEYIRLSGERQKYCSNNTEFYETDALCSDLSYDAVLVDEAMSRLSGRQKEVIIYKYLYNYSDAEISQILGITRQAVNRLIRRGINDLKIFYSK